MHEIAEKLAEKLSIKLTDNSSEFHWSSTAEVPMLFGLRASFKKMVKRWNSVAVWFESPNMRKWATASTAWFGSTYLRESVFSHMKILKSEYRSNMTDDHLEVYLPTATVRTMQSWWFHSVQVIRVRRRPKYTQIVVCHKGSCSCTKINCVYKAYSASREVALSETIFEWIVWVKGHQDEPQGHEGKEAMISVNHFVCQWFSCCGWLV